MQDGKDDLTGDRNKNGIPKFVEERDPTPLGNVILLGKRLSTTVLVWDDSLMKTELFSDINRTAKLGMILEKIKCDER
jgi:hypothetical protein